MTLPRHPSVELLESRLIHQGFVYDLRGEALRLPSGLEQRVEIVDHPGAVAVVALDGEGRMLLVRQYRHALGAWIEELPAGRLEAGESPLVAAQRELEEETGFAAATWSELRRVVPAPGFCSEIIHLFLAEGLQELPGGGRPADEDEEIEVLRRSPEEILSSEMRDAKSLLAAALVLRR